VDLLLRRLERSIAAKATPRNRRIMLLEDVLRRFPTRQVLRIVG
jgi:hypothetical protein